MQAVADQMLRNSDDTVCRICGEAGALSPQPISGYVAGDQYQVFSCPRCLTAMISPMQLDTKIYEAIYRNAPRVPGYGRYAEYAERILHVPDPLGYLADQEPCYWSIKAMLDQYYPDRQAAILDVGCGMGYLTYAMTKAGYRRVLGVDVSAPAIASAQQRYPAEYLVANIVKFAELSDERFDAIVFSEVVEHIPDPIAMLEAAAKLLVPGGRILLTTPSRTFGGCRTQLWATELPPVHLWWFSESGITTIAERLQLKCSFVDFSPMNRKRFREFWRSLQRSFRATKTTPIFSAEGELLKERAATSDRRQRKHRKWLDLAYRLRYGFSVDAAELRNSWVIAAALQKPMALHAPQSGYFSHARTEMQRYVKSGAHKVLDVGCGEGRFLTALRMDDSAERWGIEVDAAAAELSAKTLTKVINAPIEEALNHLPDAYFDCICLNDVVEHLVDPWSVLQRLRVKLAHEGEIVASIPNVMHYKNLWQLLVRADWEYRSEGILDRTHLRFFTRKSVIRLFQTSGYEVCRVDGIRGSRKLKVRFWSWISFGKLFDIRFPQFALVAKVVK